MKQNYISPKLRKFSCLGLLLGLGLSAAVIPSRAQTSAAQTAVQSVSDTAEKAKQSVEDAGKTAYNKLDQLWRKLDERRLSNRTPDEIVAWVIMGLLVGGLLAHATRINRLGAFALGLVGAFFGGLVAHLTELNLGFGPVLIRYEDLLFSLVGGVLLVIVGKLLTKRRTKKE